MNSLSWLIYLAEVLGSFRTAFGVLSGLLFFCCLGVLVLAGNELFEDEMEVSRRWWKRSVVAGFVFGAVSLVIPSSQTLYLIAASEVGEKAVSSPEAKELLGEVKTTIIKQLKNLRDEK